MSSSHNSETDFDSQIPEDGQIEDSDQQLSQCSVEISETSLEEIKDKQQGNFEHSEAEMSIPDSFYVYKGKPPCPNYSKSQSQNMSFNVMKNKCVFEEAERDHDSIELGKKELESHSNITFTEETSNALSEAVKPCVEAMETGFDHIEPLEPDIGYIPIAIDAVEDSFGINLEIMEHSDPSINSFEPLHSCIYVDTLEPSNVEEPSIKANDLHIGSVQPFLSSLEVSEPCEGIVKQVKKVGRPCKSAIEKVGKCSKDHLSPKTISKLKKRNQKDCTGRDNLIPSKYKLQLAKKKVGRPRKLVSEMDKDIGKHSAIVHHQGIKTISKLKNGTPKDCSESNVSGSFIDIVKSVKRKVGRPRKTVIEKNKETGHSKATRLHETFIPAERKLENKNKLVKIKRSRKPTLKMRMMTEQLNLKKTKADQSRASEYLKDVLKPIVGQETLKIRKLRSEKSKKENKVLGGLDKKVSGQSTNFLYQRQYYVPRTKNVCRTKATALRYPRATFSTPSVSKKLGIPQQFSFANIIDKAVIKPITPVMVKTSKPKVQMKSAARRQIRARVIKKKDSTNSRAEPTKPIKNTRMRVKDHMSLPKVQIKTATERVTRSQNMKKKISANFNVALPRPIKNKNPVKHEIKVSDLQSKTAAKSMKTSKTMKEKDSGAVVSQPGCSSAVPCEAASCCAVCGAAFIQNSYSWICCEACYKFYYKFIESPKKFYCSNAGNCILDQAAFLHSASKYRCHACWLKVCMESFIVPYAIQLRLETFVPRMKDYPHYPLVTVEYPNKYFEGNRPFFKSASVRKGTQTVSIGTSTESLGDNQIESPEKQVGGYQRYFFESAFMSKGTQSSPSASFPESIVNEQVESTKQPFEGSQRHSSESAFMSKAETSRMWTPLETIFEEQDSEDSDTSYQLSDIGQCTPPHVSQGELPGSATANASQNVKRRPGSN